MTQIAGGRCATATTKTGKPFTIWLGHAKATKPHRDLEFEPKPFINKIAHTATTETGENFQQIGLAVWAATKTEISIPSFTSGKLCH